MKNNQLTYHQWLNAINKEIKAHNSLFDFDITNYPLIDFRAVYRTGYSPKESYELIKSIATFIKHGVVIK